MNVALELTLFKLKTFDAILRSLLASDGPVNDGSLKWKLTQLEEAIWTIPVEQGRLWREWTVVLTEHWKAYLDLKAKPGPKMASAACQKDGDDDPLVQMHNLPFPISHYQMDIPAIPDLPVEATVEPLKLHENLKINNNEKRPIPNTSPLRKEPLSPTNGDLYDPIRAIPSQASPEVSNFKATIVPKSISPLPTHSELLRNLESTPPQPDSPSAVPETQIDYPLIDLRFEVNETARITANGHQPNGGHWIDESSILIPSILTPQIETGKPSVIQKPLVVNQSQPKSTPATDCPAIDHQFNFPQTAINACPIFAQPEKVEKPVNGPILTQGEETLVESVAKPKFVSFQSSQPQPAFAKEEKLPNGPALAQDDEMTAKPAQPQPKPHRPAPTPSNPAAFSRNRAKMILRSRLVAYLDSLPTPINSTNADQLRCLLSQISLTSRAAAPYGDDVDFQGSLFDYTFAKLSSGKRAAYRREVSAVAAADGSPVTSSAGCKPVSGKSLPASGRCLTSLLPYVKTLLFNLYVDLAEVKAGVTCGECKESGHGEAACPSLLSRLCELCHGVGGKHLSADCPRGT